MAKSVNKKNAGKPTKTVAPKEDGKPAARKKPLDDEDDNNMDDDEPVTKSSAKKSSKLSEDDDEDVEEVEDTWNKPDEEDNWDPDFDEFDIPKSKSKSTGSGSSPSKKSSKKSEDDDDFKLDDDFKEFGLDNGKSGGFDNDDDDY